MEPAQLQELLASFQAMAKANQDLVAEVQAGRTTTTTAATTTATTTTTTASSNDNPGAVAIAGIKVPLEMGNDAEERLINFTEWKDEIADKLTVAGITDTNANQTTIALMWGGRDIKSFAIEKAGVKCFATAQSPPDTWPEALQKIQTTMEEQINEAFAMFKFRQTHQDRQSIDEWHKKLKSAVKTLRLGQCTCGHGYNEERAIRDVMVELTNDSKLRKDALSKDLSLADLLKEGEANELARSRAATVEQNKNIRRTGIEEEESEGEEGEERKVNKTKKWGRYSSRYEKDKSVVKYKCDRCTNPRKPHNEESCYFLDKTCRVCKQVGHMGGSKACKGKDSKEVRRVVVEVDLDKDIRKMTVEYDYYNPDNWEDEKPTETRWNKELVIKAISKGKKYVVKVKIGLNEVEMFTDGGSEATVIPSHCYKKEMGKLIKATETLRGYGASKPLNVKAKFWARITTEKGATTEGWVFVVEGDHTLQPLLGDKESSALGFITFQPDGRAPNPDELSIRKISDHVKVGKGHMPDSEEIPNITNEEREECWNIVKDPKYKTIFDGHIGTMKNRKPINFQAKEGVEIISQPYRPIPPQFRTELSEHLENLRTNGKIVDVDPNVEVVQACSNVVLSRKPSGGLPMNLDARPINKAMATIITPHMNTPEDVRHKLGGSTRYSEFDMNHGYNQSSLSDESSRKYGVFQTHEGLHRFKGLYFGHKQATQSFDNDVGLSFRGCDSVEHVADNLLVHSQSSGSHKDDIRQFLDRCLEEGVTLAMAKANVCQDEVLWFGNMYGRDGVRPDPCKVKRLKEKGPPQSQEEVRSFLQAAQFNAPFMWDSNGAYAHITQPLRQLMGKGVRFTWGRKEQSSYETIIDALESAGAIYPYNYELEVCHIADAQPHGIASSVYSITRDDDGTETWWPVNHISRSLSSTESAYPQIDRESLAQSWGMTQNRYYLIGRVFNTYTDHQPLLPMYNETKKATPRIEKHILNVQDLNFTMKFLPGKSNPTDWNSRHPEDIDGWDEKCKQKYGIDTGEEVRLNRVFAVNKLDKLLSDLGIKDSERYEEAEIIEAGDKDEEYSTTRRLVATGQSREIKGEYKRIAGELEVAGKVLLRNSKYVIPKGDGTMRNNLMTAAHEGHPGLSQIKSILRGSVFWPGMTKHIEEEYKSCLACQATKEGKNHRDKLNPSAPPDDVWSKVGADHWGPIPDGSGRHILVIQDYLTKYPEAVPTAGTSAKNNIKVLEEIFGRHGYPKKLITDNGPPWNGQDTHAMKQYLKWAGIEHLPTQSADDPEANGLAERFMQEIGNAWETAAVENVDPLASLNSKLKMYRNTEHAVTKRKPAEWLFGRTIRTRLPQLQTQHEIKPEDIAAKERIIARGEAEKKRRDMRSKEEELEVGMKVLLKRKNRRKGMSKYDPEPYTIEELVGRQAVIKRGDSVLHRETQKIKKFNEPRPSLSLNKPEAERDDWEDNFHATKKDTNQVEAEVEGEESDIEESAIVERETGATNVQRDNSIQLDQQETLQESTTFTRRSARENRGRAPNRFGEWTDK